ncbi:FtsX-like permease family protein [Flavitalea sp.]|nr:FtsX-like permease family protein [Flavitalea sp.]
MLKRSLHYFFKKFSRSRTTYLVNLVGLSAGFVCCLFIYLWIYDELHVDKFYTNSDRIYSVMINDRQPDGINTGNSGSVILGQALKNTFPDIQNEVVTTPAEWFKSFSISYDNNDAVKGMGNFVGKDFFKVFPRNFLDGEENTALANINSIVISARLAKMLFDTTEGVVGKVIKWNWLSIKREPVISGVFEDFPPNSSIQFDFLVPISSWGEIMKASGNTPDLSGGPFNTFVVLNKGVKAGELNKKAANFIKQHIPNSTNTIFLAKYSDSYLHGVYENGLQKGGRIEFVKLFAIIAICVLAIACINFVNLSTAKASERMKEVGIKKTLGAERHTLTFQFLGESVLLSFVSLLIAIIIVILLFPEFKALTGKQFVLWLDPWLILSVILITLVTGIIAGSYPAFYLSRFNPVAVLNGKWVGSARGIFIRKGLVLFQFSLSMLFIAVVMVVLNQIKFVQTINPGYDKDNIIYFEKQGRVEQNLDAFLAEIKTFPGVTQVSSIQNTIILPSFMPAPGVYWDGKNADDKIRFYQSGVDFDAIETLGIKMVAGRSFSRKFADSTSIILNESAARVMELRDPIGKKITLWDKERTIVGIVKDFHFNSLHEEIKPFIFRMDLQACQLVLIRVAKEKHKQAIAAIRKYYKEFNSGTYFDYKFLSDDYQAQYAAEEIIITLSKYFAALAILISCLGLLGLTTFAAEQRIKEIGIRRTLGASRMAIIYLLSVDFARIVGLSILVGLPLSYIAANNWLNSFAYRIALTPVYFISAAIIIFLIAVLTIGIQTARASMANPIESLKST